MILKKIKEALDTIVAPLDNKGFGCAFGNEFNVSYISKILWFKC